MHRLNARYTLHEVVCKTKCAKVTCDPFSCIEIVTRRPEKALCVSLDPQSKRVSIRDLLNRILHPFLLLQKLRADGGSELGISCNSQCPKTRRKTGCCWRLGRKSGKALINARSGGRAVQKSHMTCAGGKQAAATAPLPVDLLNRESLV